MSDRVASNHPLHAGDLRDLIRSLRETTGLSQRDFADHVGVSYSTIRNWESGFCLTCAVTFWNVVESSGVSLKVKKAVRRAK